MGSLSKEQGSCVDGGIRSRSSCVRLPASLVALCLLPTLVHAQATAWAQGGDCRAANVQFADDLLQALSAARSKRSSFTFALKLLPIEVQLKSLKGAQHSESGTAAECQRTASLLEAEHGRLARLIPDLQVAPPAAPPLNAAPAAVAAPVAMQAPGLPPPGACAADNEQTRADLAQRFVHFMQVARVPSGGLAPYQNFSRRLAGMAATLSASPDDCAGHRAALAQVNIEFQQLMAMEARSAPPQGSTAAGSGDRPPDGAMPLPSHPSTEACVADLRLGFREAQQAATDLSMTQPEGYGRSQAQWLLNRVVQQQIDSFGRSPLSAEACDQSRRGLGELRASINAVRDGGMQTAARPPSPTQPAAIRPAPPQATPPAAAPQANQHAATSQPDERNYLRECMEHNRRLYAVLESEGNHLKASGRVSAPESAAFDRQLADYREWLRKTVHPIQCGVLADNMGKHLAIVREAAASRAAPPTGAVATPAQNSPTVAGQAPAAAAPGATVPPRGSLPTPAPAGPSAMATPAAVPQKPTPPTLQPAPARATAAAAPPMAQKAPTPPPAPPARTPTPPPAKAQTSRHLER